MLTDEALNKVWRQAAAYGLGRHHFGESSMSPSSRQRQLPVEDGGKQESGKEERGQSDKG